MSEDTAADIVARADEFLDPRRGLMRGLFGDDPESKLLNIRVGELRRFYAFVQQTRSFVEAVNSGERT